MPADLPARDSAAQPSVCISVRRERGSGGAPWCAPACRRVRMAGQSVSLRPCLQGAADMGANWEGGRGEVEG